MLASAQGAPAGAMVRSWVNAVEAKGAEARKAAGQWLEQHKDWKMRVDVAVDVLEPIKANARAAWMALPPGVRRVWPAVGAGLGGAYLGGVEPRRRLRKLEAEVRAVGEAKGGGLSTDTSATAVAAAVAAVQAAAAAAQSAAAAASYHDGRAQGQHAPPA